MKTKLYSLISLGFILATFLSSIALNAQDLTSKTNDQTRNVAPCDVLLVLTPTDATCDGGNMSISAAVSSTTNGISEFEINIDNGLFTAVTASPVIFNGLSTGSHAVTVRLIANPNSNCTKTENASVHEAPQVECGITGVQDVSCYDGNDGAATATANGAATLEAFWPGLSS